MNKSMKYVIVVIAILLIILYGVSKEPPVTPGNTTAAPTTVKPSDQKSFNNSIGMEFVLMPAGEFDMGSSSIYETPVHRVKISNAFYMGKYEVTQKQWWDVMESGSSYFNGDDRPVEQVSWIDVQDFINKLNEKEGETKYRLPTEAEWEYAARAGTTTRYSFGDDESKLGDYAWDNSNSGIKTHSVGQKKPNPWGLYDMHGNVWELVQDRWHYDYEGAPIDGSSWESGDGRVVRGGGWNGECYSSSRSRTGSEDRVSTVGFRLVRALAPGRSDSRQPMKSTPSLTATIIQTPKVTQTSSPTPIIAKASDHKTISNSIGMDFVLIPAGEFDMGSPLNESGRSDNEGPVHRLKIGKAFYMGKYEVTQKQWREVMGTDTSPFKGDNLPVELVSWNSVQDFITKLNEKEGATKYRLPTEAEWEYAMRAGTTTLYSFGDDESKLGDYAWYRANSGSKINDVGQKKPNPWGLYDMHGNVWEWVQDIYHGDYYGAPTDGSSWEGGGDSTQRVIRGGSWSCAARDCRSALRYRYAQGYPNVGLGFRLVRIS